VTRRHVRSRRAAVVLAAVLAALVVGGLTAPAASAHAALLATTPADGEILARPPTAVTLTFGEPVGTGLGSLKVLSSQGARADTGQITTTGGGTVVHLALRPHLARGSYLVLWRVVSADSHPVSGTFTFSVGAVSPLATGHPGSAPGPGLILGATRFLGFGALLALGGGALFCLLLWPGGLRERAVRRVLVGAAGAELLAAIGALLVQGPYAAGLGLFHSLDGTLLSAVTGTRYGTATSTRIALSAVALGVAVAVRRLPDRSVALTLTVLAGGMAATWTAAGHGGAGELQPWAAVLDFSHLLAVSAWTGGLLMLVLGLRGRWDDPVAARILPAWSRLATCAVVVLVVSGVFAGWRAVRGVDALASTPYGLLLIAKTSTVGLMLFLGLLGRTYVRRHQRSPAAPATAEDVDLLRRGVVNETGLAVVVLVVTAVLVQTVPAAEAYAPPHHGTSSAGPLRVQVDLLPARRGVNGLHVYTLGAGGRTVDVAEVAGQLVGADGTTVTVRPAHRSPGHYEDLGVVLPARGTWRLDLQIRTNDVDSYPTTQTITVR
jgi:copper transport protein